MKYYIKHDGLYLLKNTPIVRSVFGENCFGTSQKYIRSFGDYYWAEQVAIGLFGSDMFEHDIEIVKEIKL